jgi:hypothetical protein
MGSLDAVGRLVIISMVSGDLTTQEKKLGCDFQLVDYRAAIH